MCNHCCACAASEDALALKTTLIEHAASIVCHLDGAEKDRDIVKKAEAYLARQFEVSALPEFKF